VSATALLPLGIRENLTQFSHQLIGSAIGIERNFNDLRMAHALAKNDPEAEITVFLADALSVVSRIMTRLG
jgi:hypothetical protein